MNVSWKGCKTVYFVESDLRRALHVPWKASSRSNLHCSLVFSFLLLQTVRVWARLGKHSSKKNPHLHLTWCSKAPKWYYLKNRDSFLMPNRDVNREIHVISERCCQKREGFKYRYIFKRKQQEVFSQWERNRKISSSSFCLKSWRQHSGSLLIKSKWNPVPSRAIYHLGPGGLESLLSCNW